MWKHCCRHGSKSMTYNCSIGIFWFTAPKFCTLTCSPDLHPQCVAMLFALCCCLFRSAFGTFGHLMYPLPNHHGSPNYWSRNSPRCPLTKFQTGLRYKLKIWDMVSTSQRRLARLCLGSDEDVSWWFVFGAGKHNHWWQYEKSTCARSELVHSSCSSTTTTTTSFLAKVICFLLHLFDAFKSR